MTNVSCEKKLHLAAQNIYIYIYIYMSGTAQIKQKALHTLWCLKKSKSSNNQ